MACQQHEPRSFRGRLWAPSCAMPGSENVHMIALRQGVFVALQALLQGASLKKGVTGRTLNGKYLGKEPEPEAAAAH